MYLVETMAECGYIYVQIVDYYVWMLVNCMSSLSEEKRNVRCVYLESEKRCSKERIECNGWAIKNDGLHILTITSFLFDL